MNNFTSEFEQIDFPRLGYIRVPKLPIAQSEIKRLNLPPNYSNEDYLACIVKEGFDAKINSGEIPKSEVSKYWERLDFELTEITKLLFTDYILLVYNLIQFCKENNILNSPSRGSCGGSLLLYVIGVHKLDSIKRNLLFERFISATRAEVKEFDGEKYISSGTLADIDIDSDAYQKHKLNSYIESAFPSRSSAILTFGTLQGKVAIKEVLKCVENVDETEATRVGNFIQSNFGKVETVREALVNNNDFIEWAKSHEEVVKIATKINGLIKNRSVHASGIILCENPLLDTMPTELTRDKKLVTSFSMEYAQMLGIKLDNLGLKNLTAIDECFKLIGKTFKDIDVNNPSIYQYLNLKNEYYGIFQAEEGLGKMVMQKLQCKNIDDIALSIALGRPGCMRFVDEIVKAKTTGELPQTHPRIQHLLKDSYNVIVYQENIMALSREMAKFTPSESDGIRKAVGKKDLQKMASYKDKFIKQSIENGFPENFVLDTWKTFEDSGNYLFNRSHAYGYGYLTAITAYLKSNHTKEFFLSLLKAAKNEQNTLEEISIIEKEMNQLGAKLLAPHIFKSELNFSICPEGVRMGVGNIKGIAEKAIAKLDKFRHPYANKFDIFQSAEEAKIPINILSVLIGVGAMDGLYKQSRSWCILECSLWNKLTTKEKIWAQKLGEENDWDLLKIVPKLKELKDDKGKVIIKASRFETIKKAYAPYKEIYKQNSAHEDFSSWVYSTVYCGFSHGKTLKDIFIEKRPGLINLAELKEKFNEDRVAFVGQIIDIMKGTSKKGNKYIKFLVADETSQFGAWIFKDAIEQCEELNGGQLPKEGDFVIVRGTKKGKDSVFAEVVAVQKNNTLLRPSQVKETEEDTDFAPVSNIIFSKKIEDEEEF